MNNMDSKILFYASAETIIDFLIGYVDDKRVRSVAESMHA